MEERRQSILVVEDSADVREAFVHLLEDVGYRAITAGTGREALAKLHEDAGVAVIVLDARMPDMDGYEFRAAQLAIPAFADIPVVMLSGDQAMPGRARSLGIAHWLRKPSDPEALLDLLHSCANGR